MWSLVTSKDLSENLRGYCLQFGLWVPDPGLQLLFYKGSVSDFDPQSILQCFSVITTVPPPPTPHRQSWPRVYRGTPSLSEVLRHPRGPPGTCQDDKREQFYPFKDKEDHYDRPSLPPSAEDQVFLARQGKRDPESPQREGGHRTSPWTSPLDNTVLGMGVSVTDETGESLPMVSGTVAGPQVLGSTVKPATRLLRSG